MQTENAMTDSIRKAAILVSALDRDSADALLDKMGPAQAARVRNAVFDLEVVSDDEQDQIVREFMAAGGGEVARISRDRFAEPQTSHDVAHSFPLREYVRSNDAASLHPNPSHADQHGPSALQDLAATGSRAAAGPEFTHQLAGSESPADAGPFPILREASIETLAHHLVHENAQVIAVVVAHLPPRRAAQLLAQLQPRQQADVLRRVAALDTAAPAAIEILQQNLEHKLTEEVREQRNRTAGLATVNSILAAAGDQQIELFDNLTQNDQQLSHMIASARGPATSPNEPQQVPLRSAMSQTPATQGQPATQDQPANKYQPATPDELAASSEAIPFPSDDSPAPGNASQPTPATPSRVRPQVQTSAERSLTQPAAAHLPSTEKPAMKYSDQHAAAVDDSNDDLLDPPRNVTNPPLQDGSRTRQQEEPLSFEQLVELDDVALARLFQELDPEVTLVALTGASPQFVERVMEPLPPREARSLRRKMQRLGPIRLSDIATAQHEVARTATQLVSDGVLPRPAPPRFAVAA